MRKDINCVNCTKAFILWSPLGSRPATAPDGTLHVPCPYCQTINVITWPQGITFTVHKRD